MTLLRIVAVLLALSAAQLASAGFSTVPQQPISGYPITIEVGPLGGPFPRVDGSSLSHRIEGTNIFLRFIQNGPDWGPNPPFSIQFNVGRLAPASYIVHFESRPREEGPVWSATTWTMEVLDAAATPLRTVVEYQRRSVDRYFLTTDADEIEKLDRDPLWQRTGSRFQVYGRQVVTVPGLTSVCRYYGRPEAGLDSHFFSGDPAECEVVAERHSASWLLETPNAFVVSLPNQVTGACPARSLAIYRFYNNRPDVNHRYVVHPWQRDQMLSAGWIAEGYGPEAVALCSIP